MWSLVSNVAIQHLICDGCSERAYVRDLELPERWIVSRKGREWTDDDHLCASCAMEGIGRDDNATNGR